MSLTKYTFAILIIFLFSACCSKPSLSNTDISFIIQHAFANYAKPSQDSTYIMVPSIKINLKRSYFNKDTLHGKNIAKILDGFKIGFSQNYSRTNRDRQLLSLDISDVWCKGNYVTVSIVRNLIPSEERMISGDFVALQYCYKKVNGTWIMEKEIDRF